MLRAGNMRGLFSAGLASFSARVTFLRTGVGESRLNLGIPGCVLTSHSDGLLRKLANSGEKWEYYSRCDGKWDGPGLASGIFLKMLTNPSLCR